MTSLLTPRSILLLASCLFVVTSASRASAQDEPATTMAPRLYFDGQLGLLGEAHISSGSNDASDELEPSGGAVLGVDVPVVPFFSMGGEVGFLIWNTDGGDDNEIDPGGLLNVTFVPRLRIPFGNDDGGVHGAAYLAGQIGPTFSFPSEDVADGLATVGTRVNTGYGLNGGGLLGVQLFFTRSIGIDLAAGYQHHVVWHDLDGGLADGTVRIDLGQLMMRAGLAIAF